METTTAAPGPQPNPNQGKILLITAVILLLLGLALTGFGVVFVSEANESNEWPVVDGNVQNVLVRWTTSSSDGDSANPNREYHYEVTYEYIVNDQVYTADRYSLGSGSNAADRSYNEEEQARSAAFAAYQPAQSVPVHYDPADPSSAVLSPGANWGTYVPLIMGLLLLLGGAGVFWFYLRQRT